MTTAMNQLDATTLEGIFHRVQDVDNAYRSLAEKMGQLYLQADGAGLKTVTEMLDKPMRNASDNHQAFSKLVEELRMQINRAS
jgi:hypothetical protein